MMNEFDISEWLLDYENEEVRTDPHYSLYFNPEETEDKYELREAPTQKGK